MGSFKYIRDNERAIYRDRARKRELLLNAENGPIMRRVDGPTKLARAKMLGYHAKPGYAVVRIRVAKGSFRRPRPMHARRPSKTGIYFNLANNKQRVAELRAARAHSNMDIVGSYFLIENGQYKWFEVIMKARAL